MANSFNPFQMEIVQTCSMLQKEVLDEMTRQVVIDLIESFTVAYLKSRRGNVTKEMNPVVEVIQIIIDEAVSPLLTEAATQAIEFEVDEYIFEYHCQVSLREVELAVLADLGPSLCQSCWDEVDEEVAVTALLQAAVDEECKSLSASVHEEACALMEKELDDLDSEAFTCNIEELIGKKFVFSHLLMSRELKFESVIFEFLVQGCTQRMAAERIIQIADQLDDRLLVSQDPMLKYALMCTIHGTLVDEVMEALRSSSASLLDLIDQQELEDENAAENEVK